MDARQHNQQYSAPTTAPSSGAYGFNGPQNDPFNAFVNAEGGSSFESPWTSQAFSGHAPNIDGFDHNGQNWQQSPYQNPNLLSMSNYPVQTREYDQPYSRNSTSFNYSNFEPDPNQVFAHPNYDNNLGYDQPSLNDRYGYSSQRQFAQASETISPQALQNYSSTPQNSAPQQRHQVKSDSKNPSQFDNAPTRESHPLTPQQWVSLTTPNSISIYRAGLHIKPTEAFSSATNSSRLDGFIFVGNENITLLTNNKGIIPHYKRKRSRNELAQLLQHEKGDGPLHKDREPLLKKIKEASIKLGGPASVISAAQPRSGSTTDPAPSDTEDSDSDSESEEFSESDLEIEPEEPSPVPLTRPADPNRAIEYDLIKTVWARKRTVLSGTAIVTALTECWDLFKTIRDKWKARAANLQQAVEKKDNANKNTYERRVVEQRKLLESCIRLTLKHGHPSIVEKLGENPHLFVVFYQFLADRFKDNEYTGSLIASILELISRCNSVDATLLEKTKIDKILPRLVKRGDEQGRTLAQKILDNAATAKKSKSAGGESGSGSKAQPNGTGQAKRSTPDTVETANSSSNANKKPTEVDKKTPKVPANNKPASSAHSNGDAESSKVKVVQTTAKPSAFFAGLQSASKKPGTSTKGKDGKPSTEISPKVEEVKPPPKPAFSFAATMANLVKQKEAPQTKPEDTRKPETAEEKRKRVRKEQRRGLRVSFKSDHELVQIREFVHDPEEEMGHEDSQVRDVGDSRGEGQMLKMHKDLELMDEDEDYEPPEEIELAPVWSTPLSTDFSVVEEAELDRNYFSRGGRLEPESQERKIQEQRDSSTLMVVYSNLSDVPTSPREPPEPDPSSRVEEQKFGEPDEMVKEREAEYRNNRFAPSASTMAPTKDVSALLRMITGQGQAQQPPQQPPQHAPPPPAQSSTANSLTALIAQMANANTNNTQLQQAPHVAPVHQQSLPMFNVQASLAGFPQSNQNQQQAYQPQPGFSASQPAQPVPISPEVQAILAQIANQQAPQAQQMPQFGYHAANQQNDNDRKRQFDGTEQDEYGGGKKARGNGQPEKKKYVGIPVLPCRFWQEGKCRKGKDCTFLHE